MKETKQVLRQTQKPSEQKESRAGFYIASKKEACLKRELVSFNLDNNNNSHTMKRHDAQEASWETEAYAKTIMEKETIENRRNRGDNVT